MVSKEFVGGGGEAETGHSDGGVVTCKGRNLMRCVWFQNYKE